MPIPTFDMPELFTQDNARLDPELRAKFVQYTRELLDHIVEHGVEEGYINNELTKHMQAAWKEVVKSKLFDDLVLKVQKIDGDAVIRHGVGGAQLRFKLANVARWSDHMNDAAAYYGSHNSVIARLLISIDTCSTASWRRRVSELP